jgi:hypothetical protein
MGCSFVMQLVMTDPTAVGSYGAPRNVSIEYTLPGDQGSLVDINLVWTGKTPTRLAESMWLSFVLTPDPSARWSIDILGHPVSPLEVVPGGTVHTHAVGGGASVAVVAAASGSTDVLRIETLDASLVCPGSHDMAKGGLLRYNNVQPEMAGGMHFNLENNLWGTSFPQWYGDDGPDGAIPAPQHPRGRKRMSQGVLHGGSRGSREPRLQWREPLELL